MKKFIQGSGSHEVLKEEKWLKLSFSVPEIIDGRHGLRGADLPEPEHWTAFDRWRHHAVTQKAHDKKSFEMTDDDVTDIAFS